MKGLIFFSLYTCIKLTFGTIIINLIIIVINFMKDFDCIKLLLIRINRVTILFEGF